MKRLLVILILMQCFFQSFSQYLNPDDFNGYVWQRFDLSRYNAADLFDSCEIKDRKIKSAALLQVYDGTCVTDTLFVYYFDTLGKAVAQITFMPPDSSTEGDSYVRNKISDLNEVKIIPQENDWYSIITYNPYGVEKNYYKRTNNELLNSQFIFSRNYGEAYIQTNGYAELITYPSGEGSRLIGRIVSIDLVENYFTSQYIIWYQDN